MVKTAEKIGDKIGQLVEKIKRGIGNKKRMIVLL
jgi:hypothetical protein